MSKILLLEDDLSLINGLSFVFKKQGFELSIGVMLDDILITTLERRFYQK